MLDTYLRTLQDKINRAFLERYNLDSDDLPSVGETFFPRADIVETTDAFLVEIDLPGLEKDDLELTLYSNELTVSGNRRVNGKSERLYLRTECERGSFRRSFRLSHSISAEGARAYYKDGVLSITLPKLEGIFPRRIEVGSGPLRLKPGVESRRSHVGSPRESNDSDWFITNQDDLASVTQCSMSATASGIPAIEEIADFRELMGWADRPSGSDRLFVNLLIRDANERVVGEPVHLTSGSEYEFWFSIEPWSRTEMSRPFEENLAILRALGLQDTTELQLEVTCALLADEEGLGFARRRVTYYAGYGFRPESFPLKPKTDGHYFLTISLLLGLEPIHTDVLPIQVLKDPGAGTTAQVKQAEPLAQREERLNEETNSTATEVRLTITSEEKDGTLSFVFNITGQDPIGPLKHPFLTAENLNDELPVVRQLLSGWADRYTELLKDTTNNKVMMDGVVLKDMWHGLAEWGWSAYNRLFGVLDRGNPNLAKLSQEIKAKIARGSRFIINSVVGDWPWGLLCDQPAPNKTSDNFLDDVRQNFWGLKYRIQATALSNPTYFAGLIEPILDNGERTKLTVTINENMDGEYRTNHKLFFEGLTKEFKLSAPTDPPSLRLNLDKRTVINSLHDRQEPQHLYYFYCHHTQGDGKYNYRGYRNFERSKVIISGKNASTETAISFSELESDQNISVFRQPPVVFMNACESVQKEGGSPLGFMFVFSYRMAASPFIGTEAPIPAAFANEFGRRFIQRFLEGQSVGSILLELKREYAIVHNNPFGLYYSLFGNANTRLLQNVRIAS